ncbi:MAG: glycosyltransferase family 1 protein, partial [candidate division Zixibacteria bacterium]|nr:glycosyltransferase family 1 protein [candidate division Zixibacteria bacterium]
MIGPATELKKFKKRLAQNPWVGANIVSAVEWSEIHSNKFIEMFNKDSSAEIDGIWLFKPDEIAASAVEKMAEIYTRMKHKPPAWYLFSRDAEEILNQVFSNLTQSQRIEFTRQLIFFNDLPIHRIAMLGSRGVPANYSGIETYIEEVGKHLVEAGNQVTVYCHKKYVS